MRDNLLLSLTLQLVFLFSFILVDSIHQLVHTGGRLASQRLPQAVLDWEAVFKGVNGDIVKFAVHFIIHLPIPARVGLQSLSHMDNDNNALKGRGALLFVMKREPKAWVSCLYESTEFTLKPLNHLIAIGPKLDGKTLHISASFLEWTAILWLNWLTCSMGFVLPL